MGLAQLIVDVTLSALPPVWVVHYEEQSGKKAHLNGKDKELQMINISDGCHKVRVLRKAEVPIRGL